jgi:hypothetical protein
MLRVCHCAKLQQNKKDKLRETAPSLCTTSTPEKGQAPWDGAVQVSTASCLANLAGVAWRAPPLARSRLRETVPDIWKYKYVYFSDGNSFRCCFKSCWQESLGQYHHLPYRLLEWIRRAYFPEYFVLQTWQVGLRQLSHISNMYPQEFLAASLVPHTLHMWVACSEHLADWHFAKPQYHDLQPFAFSTFWFSFTGCGLPCLSSNGLLAPHLAQDGNSWLVCG